MGIMGYVYAAAQDPKNGKKFLDSLMEPSKVVKVAVNRTTPPDPVKLAQMGIGYAVRSVEN